MTAAMLGAAQEDVPEHTLAGLVASARQGQLARTIAPAAACDLEVEDDIVRMVDQAMAEFRDGRASS